MFIIGTFSLNNMGGTRKLCLSEKYIQLGYPTPVGSTTTLAWSQPRLFFLSLLLLLNCVACPPSDFRVTVLADLVVLLHVWEHCTLCRKTELRRWPRFVGETATDWSAATQYRGGRLSGVYLYNENALWHIYFIFIVRVRGRVWVRLISPDFTLWHIS